MRRVDEVALVQLAHQCLVGIAAAEVEPAHVAVRREACHLHLVREGTHFALGNLRLEQSGQHQRSRLVRRRVLRCEFAQRLGHAVQLQ